MKRYAFVLSVTGKVKNSVCDRWEKIDLVEYDTRAYLVVGVSCILVPDPRFNNNTARSTSIVDCLRMNVSERQVVV